MTAERYYDVESLKFGDIVRLWGRERLVHEVIVGRELAKGVLREGLRLQSVNPRWFGIHKTIHGGPIIGFSVRPGAPPVLINQRTLNHLRKVIETQCDPDDRYLSDEFVSRKDFQTWLITTGRAMPIFWFTDSERFTAHRSH